MAPVITRPVSEESLCQDLSIQDDKISFGEYLFLRIHQANPRLRSIFGIPGDFNLALLEHLYADRVASKVEFVGFCNELNAAYAADGYAKTIQGICALITTYGVGELSALNGIAGAFVEYAPVLHIVGTTSTKQMEQAGKAGPHDVRNIHHLVQNKNALLAPNHDVYKPLVENFSVAQESLDLDMGSNLEKIDRVLTKISQEKRPGYLFVPSDLSDIMIPRSRLSEPLDFNELTNESLLAEVSSRILEKLYISRSPSVVGDALADRFGAQEQLTSFVTALPSNFVKLFTTTLGRNIDETLPNFIGVYSGQLTQSKSTVRSLERETDFLLTLGYANDEINSGSYSRDLSRIAEVVEVHPDYIWIDGEYVHVKDRDTGRRAFSIGDLISRLTQDFDARKLVNNSTLVNNIHNTSEHEKFAKDDATPSEVITQNRLLDFFNAYLKPNDILVVETCSFLFGVASLNFPPGVKVIAQNVYGSIGYALPATFGVCRAQRDVDGTRRVLLVQGDGSAQMTVQELSTYLRYDIHAPEIFLLNNRGYTVERVIKGATRSYNDIQDSWKWTQLFKVFGDEAESQHEAETISTMTELEHLKSRKPSPKIRMYELALAKLDVPERFLTLLGRK